jgi:hypothetical protein
VSLLGVLHFVSAGGDKIVVGRWGNRTPVVFDAHVYFCIDEV